MRVLVTGSASGFGLAISAELRQRGEKVRGIDLQECEGTIQADIRNPEQIAPAVAQAIEDLGGLDVLINNAGVGEPADAGAAPSRRVVETIETNVLGAWRVTAEAVPSLVEARGRVINIASGLAFVNLPLAAAYSASKRALVAYSDILRIEYGDRIAVTTIYPGYVRTPIHRRSEQLGVSLANAVPEEPLEAVVRTISKACYSRRPRRNMSTSPSTAAAVFFARHTPALVDRVVSHRVSRLIDKGIVPPVFPDPGSEEHLV